MKLNKARDGNEVRRERDKEEKKKVKSKVINK